jgi:hypothetical protein
VFKKLKLKLKLINKRGKGREEKSERRKEVRARNILLEVRIFYL